MEVLKTFPSLCLLSIILFSNLHHATSAASSQRQTYIVSVQLPESASSDRETFYSSFLSAVTSELRLIYAYTNVFSGFAARLTEPEVAALSALPGFLSAIPDRVYQLHTTHTPDFLGLHLQQGLWNQSNNGAGIIVGLLDTGIFPDHPSFSGIDMPPPPAKWKGRCDFNASSCNNKLIGARSFIDGSNSGPPIDDFGHGTHTASTAAGAAVPGAQVLGNAYGVATGMAPLAHIAMYKVCGDIGCFGSDILAGMDAAVADGVDVLSLSLGGPSLPFDEDSIAVGAFQAIENGVFVSCAAGNSGPDASSLSNEAPWILTVAASTMDRNIRVTVELGNGQTFDGESLYQPKSFLANKYPLVYAGDLNSEAAYCTNGSFDGYDIKGKIVVCDLGFIPTTEKGAVVKSAGGVGMIIGNLDFMGYTTFANAHVIPASQVSYMAGEQIKNYINSSSSPTAALIFKGTILGVTPAPAISFFSSRGPSLASPGILKPDITGPGVNVLAAWPFPVGPPNTTYGPTFNVISGTSMSTPHLSGIAALLKAAHPDWSPAAIKSAIMTTAKVVDNTGNPIVNEQLLPADLFATGAGFVNPNVAGDPGLVYDISTDDYIAYLCGLGYSDSQVSVIAGKTVSCKSVKSIQEKDLNYPSISLVLDGNATMAVVQRAVKNVGEATATYLSEVTAPSGMSASVYPTVLRFTSVGQEKKFTVVFKVTGGGGGGGAGSLKWTSKTHAVVSPISITYKN